MTQASRHPEVDQKSTTGLEPNNQILAATLERRDPFPFELGGDGRCLERTHEPRVLNVDVLEAAAHEMRLEREPDRLDLGQLGHQSMVSSTTGRAGGRSSPSS